MSNWLMLTSRGDKHKALVRLDSVQFIREGYDNHTSIAFIGEDEFIGFAESFEDVSNAIRSLRNEGERIFKVARRCESDADSGESV